MLLTQKEINRLWKNSPSRTKSREFLMTRLRDQAVLESTITEYEELLEDHLHVHN